VRSDAAREVLGWEPQVQIDEGMRRSFDWYVANRVAPAG
jgi:nucleoside-diphosphate-sugar epimerase